MEDNVIRAYDVICFEDGSWWIRIASRLFRDAKSLALQYSLSYPGHIYGIQLSNEGRTNKGPIIIYFNGNVFNQEAESVFVLEAVYTNDGKAPNVYSELISIRRDLEESIQYLRENGKKDGWEDEGLVASEYAFACYMISIEKIDNDEVFDVTYYDSELRRIVSINDHTLVSDLENLDGTY